MPRLLIDGTPILPNPKGVGRYAQQICSRLPRLLPESWTISVLVDFPSASVLSDKRLNVIPIHKASEIRKALVLIPKYGRLLMPDFFLKTDESSGAMPGIPTLAVCHDIDHLIWAAQRLPRSLCRHGIDSFKQWLRKQTLRRCEHVFCNSQFIQSAVQQYYGIDKSKTSVAYCAVDERFYEFSHQTDRVALRHKYGVKRFVLSFATGDPRENFASLVEVTAGLAAAGVESCMLVAGLRHDSEYGKRLKQAFLRRGLLEGRHFLLEEFMGGDRLRDLVDLYTSADFYLELSLHEGFGMQLVEAMACGTTCISSPNGALREIGDQHVIWIDPTNPSEIVAAICGAYGQRLEQRNNHEQVLYTQRFAWHHTARVIADTLMAVACRHD